MRRFLPALGIVSLVLLLTLAGEARAELVKPAEAFKLLPHFEPLSGVGPKLTEDETALFADVWAGRFNKWSFEEAALLASGVTEAAQRLTYLDRIDRLAGEAEKATEAAKDPFERGELLLKWLHRGP